MKRDDIINKLHDVYCNGENYDYSLIKDSLAMDNVMVGCPKHGMFKKRLSRLLGGSGCPKCSGKIKKTFEEFVQEAKKAHGDKYEYNDTNYVNSHTKIGITCPRHGEFLQTPTNHLNGNGCPICKSELLKEINTSNIKEFIQKARNVHGNKYDYSQSVYVKNNIPMRIICPIHGEFLQTPQGHLSGRGCSKCNESHLEKEVRKLLDDKGIEYEYQWHLPWSKYYSLDFYLPKYNIGIECQGIQHFEDKRFKHSNLNEIQERDSYKKESCLKNGIQILYFSNIEGTDCIDNKELLLEEIFAHGR